MYLDDIDPYLPSALEDGTYKERLKEVTRQITDKLCSGDLDWLELFSATFGRSCYRLVPTGILRSFARR